MDYNDPGLMEAQQQSQQAGQAYTKAVSDAATLPKMLEDALNKKFGQDNPLLQQREGAVQNYMNVASGGANSVLPQNNNGMVFSPSQQQALIGGQRAAAVAPLTTINDLIGWMRGGIGNTVDSATNAFTAQANTAKTNYDVKREGFADLLGMVEKRLAQDLAERKLAADAKSGSGLDSLLDPDILRELLGLNINQIIPTEPKPTMNPTSGRNILGQPSENTNRLYTSPEGEWVFDWESNDWVPVID